MMQDRLSKIKMLAMDVDGTLTDGSMQIQDGDQIKVYSVYDGLGIRLAMNFGLKTALITGNTSKSVTERARMLGIEDIYQGARFKSEAMAAIASEHGLAKEEIAYIGDDLNDLPAFELAGFSFAPANAVDEVKKRADMVTAKNGGCGAVREAIETILKAGGKWEEAVASFLDELAKEEAGKKGPEAVA